MRRIRIVVMMVGFVVGVLQGGAALAQSPPRIVVSIKPLHALVAGVTEGVSEPELLLSGGETPHSHALRPSQAKALAAADAVFWIGPELEGFLVRSLKSLGVRGKIVTVLDAPGIEILPVRDGGIWESHAGHDRHADAHGHSHKGGRHAKGEQGRDPHLWLDPQNAKAIVRLTALEVGALFPEHRARLDANAAALAARIDALDAELRQGLSEVRERPFIVFHDAYQYFEHRYALKAAGAITVDPEQPAGAQRIREIRRVVRDRGALCVFAEPQFEPRLVATVVEGTAARRGVLDPLGADLHAGPEAYFTLMKGLEEGFRACLQTP